MLPELYPRAFFACGFRGCRILCGYPTARTRLVLWLSDYRIVSDNPDTFGPVVVGLMHSIRQPGRI